MSSFTDNQEIVLEIMKQWLREYDASFLAREDQIVYWGPIDGNHMKQGWVKYKLREVANIIRSLRVPVGIMKECTEDLLRAAAQEEGRAYVAGVTVISSHVSPEYFNFYNRSKPMSITRYHELAVHLVMAIRKYDENIKWTDFIYIYDQCCKYLGMPVQKPHHRNKFIRYALAESDFRERHFDGKINNRYNIRLPDGKQLQLTCIKLDHKSGFKQDWTKEMMRELVLRATHPLRTQDNRAAKIHRTAS